MLYGITVDRAAHPTHWMNGVSEQSPSDPRQAIEQQYRQRAEHYRAEREQLRRLDFWYSIARGAIFLLGLALAIGLLTDPRFGWGVAASVVAFLIVAGQHERLLQRVREAEMMEQTHLAHIARLARDWSKLPVPSVSVDKAYEAVARDLDLFGPRSLFQWLCVAHTPMGRQALRDWLLVPSDPIHVSRRQHVVQRLASEFVWREQLELIGGLLGSEPDHPRRFVEWATGERWLTKHGLLHVYSLALPPLVAMLAVAGLAGWANYQVLVGCLVVLVVINLVISVAHSPTIYSIFLQVTGRSNQVQHYRALFQLASQLPATVGSLAVNGHELRTLARYADTQLTTLAKIVRIIQARGDGLLGLVHITAQLLLLWDIHLLRWLERWQRRHGDGVPDWFTGLGELEALASLAHVAHDQPDWCFPVIDPKETTLRAEGIGHPLIPDQLRVGNDIEVGPPGTFVLVTGSNMSGKSTLLRSLAVNALLAQAGSPVCARQMTLPPLIVETSIRVDDSLADGVSFYLAELKRMKQIVDRAREVRRAGGRLLYLLDEILLGTNSVERQVAVVRIVRHLLEQQAIGAVSTHDLELATRDELREACRVVHFRETLTREEGQNRMTFDYRLRPGVAPTTNALILLEMVGLGDPEKSEEANHG